MLKSRTRNRVRQPVQDSGPLNQLGQQISRTSYHRPQHSAALPRKPKRDKKFSTRTRLVIVISFLAIAFIFELPLSSVPNLTVNHGQKSYLADREKVYRITAEHILDSSWLNKTKLTMQRSDFTNSIKTKFPEISNVAISLSFFSYRPSVELTLYSPALILEVPAGNYYIDDSGTAISKIAGSEEMAAGIPVVDDPTSEDIRLGQSVLPRSYVEFIQSVTAELKANGIGLEKLLLPAGTAELDAKILGSSYFIKFNLEDDYRQQAGSAVATIAYLKKKGITPTEYIDVRVDGRAYYQ